MIKVVNKYKHIPTDNDYFIGRGSPLGNPFTHLSLNKTKALYHCETREEAINSYKKWIDNEIQNKNKDIIDALNEIALKTKNGDVNLVCYCKPDINDPKYNNKEYSCHGDYIKSLIEQKFI